MSEPEKNKDINNIDDLLKDLDKQSKESQNTDSSIPQISVIPPFIDALKGISEIVAEHTHIESIRLTAADCETLKTALKPLEKYIMQFLNLMIYLPLIVFAIGYTMRIITEIKDKKKDKVKKNTQAGFSIERDTAPNTEKKNQDKISDAN